MTDNDREEIQIISKGIWRKWLTEIGSYKIQRYAKSTRRVVHILLYCVPIRDWLDENASKTTEYSSINATTWNCC